MGQSRLAERCEVNGLFLYATVGRETAIHRHSDARYECGGRGEQPEHRAPALLHIMLLQLLQLLLNRLALGLSLSRRSPMHTHTYDGPSEVDWGRMA